MTPKTAPQAILAHQVSKTGAVRITAAIDARVAANERDRLSIGRLVLDALHRKVHVALSMTAKEWMLQRFGRGAAQAWRWRQVAKDLKALPESTLRKLKEGNAFALSRLPEQERTKAAWVKDALETPNVIFAEQVDKHIEKVTQIKRDRLVPCTFKLKEQVAKLLEMQIKRIADANDWDLELHPHFRADCFEVMVVLVSQATDNELKAEPDEPIEKE